MRPDDARAQILDLLGRARRRLVALAVGEGAGIGLALGAVIWVLLRLSRGSDAFAAPTVGVPLVLLGAGFGAALIVGALRSTPIALRIDRRTPSARNVIVTASELIAQPERTPTNSYVRDAVLGSAARIAATLTPSALFPARRAAGLLGIGALAWAVAGFATRPSVAATLRATSDVASPETHSVVATVVPPSYASRKSEDLRDPTIITALAGSRVRLSVRASADSVTVETLAGIRPLAREGDRFVGDVPADADGFIAVQPHGRAGARGTRRLIGLTVTPDHAPRVKLTNPGRDLFFPTGARSIPIEVEADDDIGLASLRLLFTRVAGSGEQFTFTTGEVPLTTTRTSATKWTARGTLRLDSLKLESGDMIVYRGVATDRRPGAAPSESDTYIIEITSPGAVAAEGFATDDQQDKYALSQQMIIVKTEKLIAGAPRMSRDSVADQAALIAAEQRAVRAEFVFMMGGELAEEVIAAAGLGDLNEEKEAAGEEDLAAGRMANRGRIDLVLAIRSMSQANALLNDADLAAALKQEKSALTHLQGAFARARYILRALTQRERLDLSRRMSGVLAALGRDVRPAAEAQLEPTVASLRSALAHVTTLASEMDGRAPADAQPRASALAEEVLRIDPASSALQGIGRTLSDAAAAVGKDRSRASALLDRAGTELASVIRASLAVAPTASPTLEMNRLGGALTDALRRGGRR